MDMSRLPREKTTCIICGSDETRRLSLWKGWQVARCRVCGLVYLPERPSAQCIEEMYGRDYYENGSVAGYDGYVDTYRRYEDVFERLFDRRMRDLEPYAGDRRLLDVGCAHGFLLDHFRRNGWCVQGVEASPLASTYARDELGLDVVTGALPGAGLRESSFDVILLLDVLEHLHRPYETLREAGRLLSPEGVLVVQCPWELSHWEEVGEALLRGRRTGGIEPDSLPAHLYFFTPRTLDAVLERGGFRIIRRQSGNYGEIRRRISPPAIRCGSPFETLFRFLYFGTGLRRLLYSVTRRMGLGNGLIRYVRFTADSR
jgi:SAM-dependent methyltransferase